MHTTYKTAGCGQPLCRSASRASFVSHAPVRTHAAAAPTVGSTGAVAALPTAQLEDKFLAKNLPAIITSEPTSESLKKLRASAWQALPSLRMPTTRNEDFRFTDITSLLKTALKAASSDAPVASEFLSSLIPPEAAQTHAVLVNGQLRTDLSNLSGLPKGTYVGGAANAPAAPLARLGGQAAVRGGPFSVINAAAAPDVLVVSVPAEATVTSPLYVLHISTGGSAGITAASAPRFLVHLGVGSSLSLVEEWVGLEQAQGQQQPQGQTPYFACAVSEVYLEKDAQISHGYAVRESAGAVHIKATLVEQEESSSYTLTEARLGGALTRHDVIVKQSGPRTSTTMRHFILAGSGQVHDLHTKLSLDHPEGVANQMHKCIVTASSGRGVFDGNVHVGRLAQRTDAGQLSRNLLLAPRATVNVKPNLQIIADDVKCTHGCAISDLSEEELFYFRARGISALAARQALVSSFGAEVTRNLNLPALQARMQSDVKEKLQGVDLTVMQA